MVAMEPRETQVALAYLEWTVLGDHRVKQARKESKVNLAWHLVEQKDRREMLADRALTVYRVLLV